GGVAQGGARARPGRAVAQAGARLHRVRPRTPEQLPADVHDPEERRAKGGPGEPRESRARRLRAPPGRGRGVHRAAPGQAGDAARRPGGADPVGGGGRTLRAADHARRRRLGEVALGPVAVEPPARNPLARDLAALKGQPWSISLSRPFSTTERGSSSPSPAW